MRESHRKRGQTGGGREGKKKELIQYIKKRPKKKKKCLNGDINNEMIVQARDGDRYRDRGR